MLGRAGDITENTALATASFTDYRTLPLSANGWFAEPRISPADRARERGALRGAASLSGATLHRNLAVVLRLLSRPQNLRGLEAATEGSLQGRAGILWPIVPPKRCLKLDRRLPSRINDRRVQARTCHTESLIEFAAYSPEIDGIGACHLRVLRRANIFT